MDHVSELYVFFVEIQKAYDSIPHAGRWLVWKRLGGKLNDGITIMKRLCSGYTLASHSEGCTAIPRFESC